MASLSRLQGVPNFRDVGYTVNKFLGERRIREGLIYRSGRLDTATAEDKQTIREDWQVKTVIDLRTKTEILKEAKSKDPGHRAPHSRPLGCPVDGIDYRGIKITGRPFERYMLSQLSWWDFLRVICLSLLGCRIDAARVVCCQILRPKGLVGIARDTLDCSGTEICQILSSYISPQSFPLIVHCTQGKDRTGLVCVLLLMILGIPLTAIEYDYSLSDTALAPYRDEILFELHSIGLNEDWASTAKDMVVNIEKHMRRRYGGLDDYLSYIGFDPTMRAQLRNNLLYEPSHV